jgi:hypothetical protein
MNEESPIPRLQLCTGYRQIINSQKEFVSQDAVFILTMLITVTEV